MHAAEPRPLRADARQNHDKLLAVAARHFAADGPNASLKSIAKEAGVGIGTLYRRFPSRELLIEQTYRHESDRLCASAYDLLDEVPPPQALRTWMTQFLEYLATKRGMADALRFVLTADEALRVRTRTMLIDVMTMLVGANETSGTIRAGIRPNDLVMALGGIAMIADDQGDPELSTRLLDLLLSGVFVRRAPQRGSRRDHA